MKDAMFLITRIAIAGVGGGAIVIAATILHGFVLQKLWFWFLAPLGVPAIGIANAIGIGTIMRWVSGQYDYHVIKTAFDLSQEDQGKALVAGFAVPLGILAIGWLITLFM